MILPRKISLTKWGVIFLITILPFSFALNPSSNIDLSIIRILIPLTFLLWIFEGLLNKKIFLDIKIKSWILVFVLILSSLSILWSPSYAKAIRKVLFLTSIFPIYWVAADLLKEEKTRVLFLRIVFHSTLISAVVGIVQFSLQFIVGINSIFNLQAKLTPFFLGNNFSEMVLTHNSWLVNVGGKTIFRAISFFPDPHLFSLFLNIALPIGAYLFLKTKRFYYLVGTLLILLASLLTFSRAGYLSLIIAFLFIWVHFLSKKNIWNILLGLIVIAFLSIPNPINQRLYSTLNFQDGSVSERLFLWKKGIDITKDNFWGGVGIGNLSEIINPLSDQRNLFYAHNLFLDFSSEIGFWGGLAIFLLITIPISNYLKTPNDKNFLLATIFIVILVHSMFETPFYSVRLLPLILTLLAI